MLGTSRFASRLGIAVISASCGLALAEDSQAPKGINTAAWEELTLVKKEQINHDSILVRLGFKDSSAVSGLTIASCLLLKAPIGQLSEDGKRKDVIRPYTPTSDPSTRGYLDLVVKVYENGNMSKYLGEMSTGDAILCKGPIQKLPYEPNMKKKIGMVAGGSGITPMIQVIDAILENPKDQTEVYLVYANKSVDDILLKDKLDALVKKHSNLHVHYVVEKAGMFSTFFSPYTVGYVTPETISKHCPSPSEDHMVMVCGPPPMMRAISGDKSKDKSQGEISGILAFLGYTKEQVYKF